MTTVLSLSAAILLLVFLRPKSAVRFTEAKDLFFFAGQSNMAGWTNWADGGIEYDGLMADTQLFDDVVAILENNNDLKKSLVRASLRNRILVSEFAIHDEEEGQKAAEKVAAREASQLTKLLKRGLLDDLKDTMVDAECSFINPGAISAGTVPVSFDSMCGRMYGHELTFAKSMKYQGYSEKIVIHKVAVDGTKIEEFMPESEVGVYWAAMNRTIHRHARDGNLWKGFVWHQGSQDTHEGSTYLTYGDSLKTLVQQVRYEMCTANAGFADPNCAVDAAEIPVVIVQLGAWPRYDFAPFRSTVVRQAQASFAEEDPRAALVTTDDLSHFFHYEATSFLISGDRIAKAMVTLIVDGEEDGNNVCYMYGSCFDLPKKVCKDKVCKVACVYEKKSGCIHRDQQT